MSGKELLTATIEETEKAVLAGKTKLSIIDTRTPAQMMIPKRIPTAKNIPGPVAIKEAFALDNADFKNRFGVDKPVKGDSIILHCNSGMGAGKTQSTIMNDDKYKDLANAYVFKNLSGGVRKWLDVHPDQFEEVNSDK